MKIIISPAKRMRVDDTLPPQGLPQYLDRAQRLLDVLRAMPRPQLQKLLCCNSAIADLNYERYQSMDLHRAPTPAIFAFDGIQYQYMAPQVFEDGYFDYIQRRLFILSGFYGALRPFDGVTPYRLEMQARLRLDGCRSLYEYWGDLPCAAVTRDASAVVNLASEEYARAVTRHLPRHVRLVTCIFGEKAGERVIEKGVYVKMARGEMVRFMAENGIDCPDDLRGFDRLGFQYDESLSSAERLVFIKPPKRAGKMDE